MPEPIPCPLCKGRDSRFFHRDTKRDYLRCPTCSLVWVPPAFHLSPAEEKAEYDLHQNDPADPGYRRFLSRLFTPLQARLPDGARGLDFGCGPGPALAQMFEEAGHPMEVYDPFYADRPAALKKSYTFITASEVLEHLRAPGPALDRLHGLLLPGGWLGVMTKLVSGREAFVRWHYKNDRTHICFFSRATFAWLARRWKAELEIHGKDVILLRKNPATDPAIAKDSGGSHRA